MPLPLEVQEGVRRDDEELEKWVLEIETGAMEGDLARQAVSAMVLVEGEDMAEAKNQSKLLTRRRRGKKQE